LHRASFSPHPQPPAGPHRTVLLLLRSKAAPLRSAFSPASLRVFEEAKTFFARGGPRLSSPHTHTQKPQSLTTGQFPPSPGQCRGRPVSGIGVTAC
jgi:hypothetical protein